MRSKHRNIFLLIGLLAVAAMLCTLDMPWGEVLGHVRRAGVWLPAAVALWLPIYMVNARSWQVILNDGECAGVGFWRMFKYTVSGYALNYVTPVGLLGGEPYRIMELSARVGATRATSSVILYSMTHILSHFCFWALGALLFVCLRPADVGGLTVCLLGAVGVFCLLGVYFFLLGYRNGFALRALRLLAGLPVVGGRIGAFAGRHAETLRGVDAQIAALHRQRRGTFYLSLSLELLARLLGCLEVMFALLVFTPRVSYWDCVFIQAFSSLFANVFFFVPMQMGTREGGLALVADTLRYGGAYGVLAGLMTRLRELVWIAVGLLLIRVGNGGGDAAPGTGAPGGGGRGTGRG